MICTIIYSVAKYEYEDGIGALIAKDTYVYESTEYTDRVTSFNGTKISYDEIGNPLKYYDGKEFSWSGRLLDDIRTEDTYINYAYDTNGLRLQKNVDGTVTDYYYDGEDVILEVSPDGEIWYIYDDTTGVLGFSYKDNNYYYVKNASGDVVAIVDDEGNYVCGYSYDAWGNLLNTDGNIDIAKINPIRYKSYYYDVESGFYYLKTRYYDPEARRFISMDDVRDIAYESIDPNMYAYCCGDPVNLCDPEGRAAVEVGLFAISQYVVQTHYCLVDDILDDWDTTVHFQYAYGDEQDEFAKWWNGLELVDIVYIFIHGTPISLTSHEGGLRINDAYMDSQLNYQLSIKLLVLVSCNAGHYSSYNTNIAHDFAEKISGVVVASDGTVYVGHKYSFFGDDIIEIESRTDNTFKEWLDTGETRDNYGWLLYSTKWAIPKRTGLKSLSEKAVYSLYCQKVWNIYK